MLATVPSAALRGMEVLPVEVEVAISRGTPMIQIVGLAESAIREGRERIRAASREAGHAVPGLRITVNLAPADVRKHGSAFDLPITVGILAARKEVPPGRVASIAMLGELGLDGGLRPVRGVLPVALHLEGRHRRGEPAPGGLIVPLPNLPEARPASSVDVRGARDLREVLAYLRGERSLPAPGEGREPAGIDPEELDLADVAGHEGVKRALEVAASGGHHLLLRGSPGGGKTMLARRAATVLPDLTPGEAVEITAVHSVAGTLRPGTGLLQRPPCRAPHHTVTRAGLAGGGAIPRPGEVSLAHRGVLFLDEITEFRRSVLEVLRQPLEEGRIGLVRSSFAAEYPARFILVAAMNPWGFVPFLAPP